MMMTLGQTSFGQPSNSLRPALICEVPKPRDTASPNKVPSTAKTSMVLPIGP